MIMRVMVCFYVAPFLQIVSRYDIIVILEVVDSSGDAVDNFLEELNKWVKQVCFFLKKPIITWQQ